MKRNLGPAERWLFGNRTTHQSIRIARGGGVPATAHIAQHADRIGKLAKVARGGGIALAGVGLTASCMEIANTASQEEKNEIFVETVASTTAGAIGGLLVGVFLVSNPIGWGVALTVAAGSVATSYAAGKGAVKLYDTFGQPIDPVSGLGVDRICR